jgi:hypothetical protein
MVTIAYEWGRKMSIRLLLESTKLAYEYLVMPFGLTSITATFRLL